LIRFPVLIRSAALFASKVALFSAFAVISALALDTVIILLAHRKNLIVQHNLQHQLFARLQDTN
jgi:hypothetical protein